MMHIYCDVEGCKHCEDGMCECVWKAGTHAIKISENYMGIPYCTDFVQKEEEEGQKESC